MQSSIEEDIDSKNHYGMKNSPGPFSIREAASKNYVDKKFNDSSIIQNNNPNIDIDPIDRNIINAGLIEVNQLPEIGCYLVSKL